MHAFLMLETFSQSLETNQVASVYQLAKEMDILNRNLCVVWSKELDIKRHGHSLNGELLLPS